MRTLVFSIFLSGGLFLAGCAGTSPQNGTPGVPDAYTNAPMADKKVIVTPEEGLDGEIVWVNTGLRFVVLTFPVGQMPSMDQRLHVYRNGSKIGEVKVTGPVHDENIVADIVMGDPEKGDAAREK